MRGSLHAEHQRRAGRHQDDRARDRRPRLGEGLDRAANRRESKTGKKVAVVGSGPAGLAAAQQLARAGHDVHVFEKNAKPGGLLRYGIPDFKMEKHIIDRRVEQMEAEGVAFHCGVARRQGSPIGGNELRGPTSTRCCSPAAPSSRATCRVPGRDLDGVHFAMEFLPQQNRPSTASRQGREPDPADGKHVIVIGGGDTGSDCVGTIEPPGREVGDAVRDHADAARAGEQAADLAVLAA